MYGMEILRCRDITNKISSLLCLYCTLCITHRTIAVDPWSTGNVGGGANAKEVVLDSTSCCW